MKKSIILIIIAAVSFNMNFKSVETKMPIKKSNVNLLKEDQMKLESTSFTNGQDIPVKYCKENIPGGKNISPQFSWSGIPKDAKSLVLAIVDHHPIASDWVHWLVVDIPAGVSSIDEGASKTDKMPAKSKELTNTFGLRGYDGPSPPKGTGKHNYEATIYALSIPASGLNGRISEADLLVKIRPYIIDKASLTGYFGR